MQKPTYALLLATLLSATAAPALAAPIRLDAKPADRLGPFILGPQTYYINSPVAFSEAYLRFDLLGYGTVDGMNSFTDTFKLTINNKLMFEGGFDMGGGGTNFTTFKDPGVSFGSISYVSGHRGEITQFLVRHTMYAGYNHYRFNYGRMQGLDDEGWGLRRVAVRAYLVPEPATWGLMLAGLGALGLSSRRSRSMR